MLYPGDLMRVVNHFSLNRAAYEIRRLRIMHSEVRRNFILIKVRVAVPAAVRAGVVGPDVISEKAAALLLVLLSFLIRYRCRTPRPFLHSPFRFRDCKLYVPDVLKGMVRHAAADIDPVLPQILILIAADKADAVPPRSSRRGRGRRSCRSQPALRAPLPSRRSAQYAS